MSVGTAVRWRRYYETTDRFLEQGEMDCWIWQGYIDPYGYGRVNRAGAHQAIYRELVGPCPSGLELDHLCDTPACVNPGHLDPVTHRENMLRGKRNPAAANARKTHCIRGHEFDEENTYWRPVGSRLCRKCKRASRKRWPADTEGLLERLDDTPSEYEDGENL